MRKSVYYQYVDGELSVIPEGHTPEIRHIVMTDEPYPDVAEDVRIPLRLLWIYSTSREVISLYGFWEDRELAILALVRLLGKSELEAQGE